MATVPVFAPDGTLGDVPQEKVQDALKAGFRRGHELIAPNGEHGIVPEDKLAAAMAKGFKPLVPPPIQKAMAPQTVSQDDLAGSVTGVETGGGTGIGDTSIGYAKGAGRFVAGSVNAYPPIAALNNVIDSYNKATGSKVQTPFRTPDYLQPSNPTQQAAGYAAEAHGAIASSPLMAGGAQALLRQIPSKARAGQALNEVAQVAKESGLTVNPSAAAGGAALRIQEFASRGGTPVKGINQFIQRVTKPDAPPLTYQEARDFYSNLSRLTVEQKQKLTPNTQRMVGEFVHELGPSIQDATATIGQAQKYMGAMKEYNQASTMNEALKKAALIGVPSGLATAFAEYLMHKYGR